MSLTLFVNDLTNIPDVAKQILEYTSPHKKFAFYADMGVGKTTLIKELSLQLDVVDVVSSPTFSIVNEYQTKNKSRVYHFDFYRLEEEQEAYDMGYEEYFFSDDYCFIEWPEKIPSLIGEDMVIVKMHIEETKRVIEVII
jgi:tRNA threonylcarbamoyladenosine biosynthesis protein TsaE|tara:strand:- start:170 stop:589 length:420 start_codon:yes stop_codon:yes gene_type:complete